MQTIGSSQSEVKQWANANYMQTSLCPQNVQRNIIKIFKQFYANFKYIPECIH